MTAFAETFSGLFAACGESLVSSIKTILPSVMVLLMVFHTVCILIGEERIARFSRFLARRRLLAYTVLPFISWFFLCSPMAFSTGRLLPQRQRAGYIDACATMNGPMLSLFPHTNPGEYFIWWGVASGVESLGLSVAPLAIRFFLGGLVLALLRACLTERLWVLLARREGIDVDRGPSAAPPESEPAGPAAPAPSAPEPVPAGFTGATLRLIQVLGRGIGRVVDAFFTGARQAVRMTISNILPFLLFLSFLTGLMNATGLGAAIANGLSIFTGSVPGLIVFALIIGIPVLSPLLGPGAVVQSILGTLIGSMIASGAIPVTLALPALFAISVVDACDFIPVAASLGEAEPDTARVAVPAMLFSRFLTAPLAILTGVLASIGLF